MTKKKRKYCPFCGDKITIKKECDISREYCLHCTTFFYDNPLPVVSSIVMKDREVLLVKRGNPPYKGKWCLPSGFAETGESIQAAALRELEEETGVIGQITGFVNADSVTNYYYGDLIFLTFEVEQTGGITMAGDDAVEVRYFPIHKTPKLAFTSNEKALKEFIKMKSEFWAIIDSFSLSISEKGESQYQQNFLSDQLVDVIQNNAGLMAEQWINDVSTNKSTPHYHEISHDQLASRFHDDVIQYVNWLNGDYNYQDMKAYYRRLGKQRRLEGFALGELLSALSLVRKYIWEFALSHGMWQKTIDIYRTLELERRMMLFFDKVSYHVCRGYEKENGK